MHHPTRAASGWPPGGSGGPAAAASRAGSLCCGLMLRYRTRGGRARGRSSSRRRSLKPRKPPLVRGSIDRSAAASRAPWMACAAARACVATGVKLSRPWRCSVLAAPAPAVICVGRLEKKWVSAIPRRSDTTLQQLLRSGSDATILQRVEPSDAANAVAQPANKIEACPAAGDFQAYGKSRLPGQMSRHVKKPPACGRFGLVLVSYSASLGARRLLFTPHPGAYSSRSGAEKRPSGSRIAALKH